MANVLSGNLPVGYGCGGYQNAVNGPNTINIPNSCPSKCSGHTSPPNCINGCPCGNSPIIIDVKGEGFHLTSLENGVTFRIRGNTPATQFSWTDPQYHNAWLALPQDGSLDELFGNFSPQPPSDTPNGYRALAYFAQQQGCGTTIKPLDYMGADNCPKAWNQLRIWTDSNHDGISQIEELHTLDSMRMRQISLQYKESRHVDEYGHAFFYKTRIDDDAGPQGNLSYGRVLAGKFTPVGPPYLWSRG